MILTSVVMSVVLLIAFVIAPAVAGIWLIVVSRKRGLGFPGCGRCKYDLSGTLGTAARCPECGADIKEVGVHAALTQRRTGALVAGIGLLCVPLLCIGAGIISAYATRSQLTQARQVAMAAQAQSMQQMQASSVATSIPDANLVRQFRRQHAECSIDEASSWLGEVNQRLAEASAAGDVEGATQLRAEQQALMDHLNEDESRERSIPALQQSIDAGATRLAPVLMPQQIDSMSLADARIAVQRCAEARDMGVHDLEQQRLRAQFNLLLHRIREIRALEAP